MLPRIDPSATKAWQELAAHASEMKRLHMRDQFASDPKRFERFSVSDGDILFDYSKNIITDQTLALLQQLALECRLPEAIRAMFNGDKINETEQRSVLHTALRNFSKEPVFAEGKDVMPGINKMLRKIKAFCDDVHNGNIRGYTGKRIKYIVNIGIGGSDLGPQMVTEALRAYREKDIEVSFVSNIDGTHLSETLKKIKAERTLFVIASKTFTTQETMTNADSARRWFLKSAKQEKHIASHFIAVSANETGAVKFGIDKKNIFTFQDWVGGRFSLWSAAGLTIALTIGYKNFEQLLRGAGDTDIHFLQEDHSRNIPVLMALISLWYVNFMGAQSEVIVPYDQYMKSFAPYMQQAHMESNGKSTDRNGIAVSYSTSPVIWGEPGTNGQHAFFQLFHQGTPFVPCDLIAAAQSHNPLSDHHEKLLSNFFAQSQALMCGKTENEVRHELAEQGLSAEQIVRLLPYKIFPGNRPTNSFLIKKITPFTLGKLIAYYEHKIFVQGVIWNIFSFDQWGVELGKQLANTILPDLQANTSIASHDSSTNGLINAWKRMNK
jgi:glucose-6-phosphate isomerase